MSKIIPHHWTRAKLVKEFKRTYRVLLHQIHPDKQPPERRERATELTRRVIEIYKRTVEDE